MKKKYIIAALLLILAGIVTLILWKKQSDGTLNPGEKDFAIADTSTVTKVFLADKKNRTVLLQKQENSAWKLNDKFEAQPNMINELLRTFMYVSVKAPVPRSMKDNVVKRLASFGIKVEIYAKTPWINLWGFKLFERERLIRTYYVGDNTMDNTGTFMMMEGSDQPYITYIPGFNGFLQTRYSTKEYDWRDHSVFNYSIPEIAKVKVEYPGMPENSFMIENNPGSNYKVYNGNGQILGGIDTNKVVSYLSSFTEVKFETFLNELDKTKADSLLSQPVFAKISVLPVKQSNWKEITFFRIKSPEGTVDLFGEKLEYDRERLHAITKEDGLIICQYFVFGSLFRQLGDFVKSDLQSKKK